MAGNFHAITSPEPSGEGPRGKLNRPQRTCRLTICISNCSAYFPLLQAPTLQVSYNIQCKLGMWVFLGDLHGIHLVLGQFMQVSELSGVTGTRTAILPISISSLGDFQAIRLSVTEARINSAFLSRSNHPGSTSSVTLSRSNWDKYPGQSPGYSTQSLG